MSRNVQKLCVTALGIALFVALSMCVRVPVFENYYICLGYVAMAVYCYSFGTVSGTVAGTLGVVLYCVLTGGLRGMPGWSLGNLVIGIVMGLTFKATKKMKNPVLKTVINAVAVTASVAVGILGVKSLTECVLYAQPFPVRVGKNIYAFVADTVTLIVSLPVCASLDKVAGKMSIK